MEITPQQDSAKVIVKNVSKSFFQGTRKIEVLADVNFQIKNSESVALLGPSGSGKSTLLSLLSGLEKPDNGQIFIHNQNIVELNQSAMTQFRGRHIGIIFQQFHLLPQLTALENVMLPAEILKLDEPKNRALQLMEQVGLSHRLQHFPGQLSGGECQRVAVARALMTEPDIILADEPSGNLDETTGFEVMDIIFNLIAKRHSTLFLITHDKSLADRCHRTLKLSHGVIE